MDDETDEKPKTMTPRMLRWVKNSCVYRLNQKMMSEKELFDALAKKAAKKFDGIDKTLRNQIAQAGIDFCNENKFLDDTVYAQTKTGSASRGGKSKRMIAMTLSRKGIDADLIQASLEDVDDLQGALNFARKRAFGPYRKVELDEKRKAKEYSALARNGYSAEIARKVLTMNLEEVEEMRDGAPMFS